MDNNGAPVGDPVSATDTGNYFGAAPAITLDKQVNNQDEPTAPGLFIPVGQPVTFTYIVTNTGNVTLDPVTVDDDILGPVTCPETSLAPGTSETCTAPGGNATAGPHQNTATVTGQGVDDNDAPVGTPATANALANDFGEAPSITLTKNVNGQHQPNPPGSGRPGRLDDHLHLRRHQHRQRDPQPSSGHRRPGQPGQLPADLARPRPVHDLHRQRRRVGGPADQHRDRHRRRRG